MSQLRTAILELQSVLERTSVKDNDEIVSFEGKKGKWRTSHGSRVFIPMDGSAAEIPRKGPDINLDKEAAKAKANQDKAPPAAGGTTPKRKRKLKPKPPSAAGGSAPEPKSGEEWDDAKKAYTNKKSHDRRKKWAGKLAGGKEKASQFLTGIGLLSKEAWQGTKKFVAGAPASVKKFLSDKEYRDEGLAKSADFLKNLPEKGLHAFWETAKEEYHESGKAIQAIGKYAAVMAGATGTCKTPDEELDCKPSPEEIKALKEIALHLAIGGAGRALAASGLGLPAAFALGVTKYIAIKAVSKTLSHMATINHASHIVGHLGHGEEAFTAVGHGLTAVKAAHTARKLANAGHLAKGLSKALTTKATAADTAAAALGAKADIGHALMKAAKFWLEGDSMDDQETGVLSEASANSKEVLKFLKQLMANIGDEMKNLTPEDLANITAEVAAEAEKQAKAKSKKEEVDTGNLSELVRKLRG